MKHLLPLLLLSLAVAPLGAAPQSKPLPLESILKAAAKIDALLEEELAAKGLEPLPIVADDVFVRRAYVAIAGRIPTAQEAARFLENGSADKRQRLIEELVASPGYDSAAFNYFADLLRLQTNHEQYGLGWHVWLRKSLNQDKPWDRMVNEMLSAEGHSVNNPAAGYYLRDRN
ncbi:MAG: DUF1549 domain-containing protein, partial [Akkermansiaceae bacterium]|nr:DUF1549 domain-containing protein [Akkermansiaceae bacterium]